MSKCRKFPKGKGSNSPITFKMQDGTEKVMSINELHAHLTDQGVYGTKSKYQNRWLSLGCADTVDIEMMTCETTVFMAKTTGKVKRVGYTKRLRKSREDDLSHIPLGDLVHLSSTENTGAAREGCEQWEKLGRRRKGPASERNFL